MRPLKKRLMRNPYRSRLGGVCAGLADYTGLSHTLFRILFLVSLLFGGFGLWVYLILWLAVPARDTIPITDASLALRWQLFRLGRRINRIHRSQSPYLADQAQLAYEAVRTLAFHIDLHRPKALNHDTARLALIEFPSLLEQIDRAGHLMADPTQDERSQALQSAFSETCNRLIEESRKTLEPEGWQRSSPETPEVASFRLRLQSLTKQLSGDTSPAIKDRLEHLETHLHQLLMIKESALNDIGPIRAHEIRRIAFDFLPDTLDAYLKIQGPLARTQILRDHKTAEDLFQDQLDLLDQTLEGYSRALLDRDAKSLLIQGHFLREKFGMEATDHSFTQARNTHP